MYEVSIEREFCAAHAIVVAGEREPVHGHTWRVRVVVEGPALDGDGLLADFHLLERRLDEVLDPFRNRDLNRTPPFDGLNPTAEHVARYLARRMAELLGGALPAGTGVRSVSVTEAPGCTATYRARTS